MKIIRHTKTYLELGSQDPYTAKVALSFGLTFLAIGILLNILGFNTAVVLIAGSFILIFGAITANFEMNCQFDHELDLFKLSYRNLIRQKKIERPLQAIDDVRLEQDKDVEGGIFYYLVIMINSGKEIKIPHLLHTSHDIKTYELILTKVKSFIHDRK